MFETTEYGAVYTTMTVIKNVAEAAGVVDSDFLTPAEIRDDLAQTDPETSRLLEAFLAAFKSWYDITELVQSHLHDDRVLLDEHAHASENRRHRGNELKQRLRSLNDHA